MESSDTTKTTDSINEDWFIAQLGETPVPYAELEAAVRGLAACGDVAGADNFAELLQGRLGELQDLDDTLRLLVLRVPWRWQDSTFRGTVEKALSKAFKERPGPALVASCGLNKGLPITECLRRLILLRNLKPGTMCFEKTWGFGVIKSVDDFYCRITVDFTRKQGHVMTLEYAAETLQVIQETHVLARRYRDPAGMAKMIAEAPGEVVKLVLQSFGSRTAPDLQRVITDLDIVKEADWKPFWDGARRALKKDPGVDLPAKRNELIRLLEGASKYDGTWFDGLSKEKDMDRIVEKMETLLRESPESVNAQSCKDVLADRAAFAAKGARGTRPDLLARLLMLDKHLPVRSDKFVPDDVIKYMLDDVPLLGALEGVSARDIGEVVEILFDAKPVETLGLLRKNMYRLGNSSLAETLRVLTEKGKEQDAAEQLRALLSFEPVGLVGLSWVARNIDRALEIGICTSGDFFRMLVESMDRPASMEELKAQKTLRALLDQGAWVEALFRKLDDSARSLVVRKVMGTRTWDSTEKRSLLAKILKIDPSMQSLMSGPDEEKGAKQKSRFTSWRSYRERSAQYKKLIEIDIPANSREIAVARSYGDLRENAEFKAAKEHQTVLLRKKEELEVDLKVVMGSDFKGVSTSAVGMGTEVVLKAADGKEQKFRILGEWDRDEALGIISSSTQMAKALEGKGLGDKVKLVGEGEGAEKEIIFLGPLSDEVRAWIQG